jgi:hypothetical protein
MTTTTLSAALVLAAPVFTNTERLALAGFLAGYSGLTREAYELDLRQYTSWCHQHHLRLFQARRADIECFARDLEARGRARATITRRLCTIAGFYRYAVEEELLCVPRRAFRLLHGARSDNGGEVSRPRHLRPLGHAHQNIPVKTWPQTACQCSPLCDAGSGAPPAASRPRPRSCRPNTVPRHRRAHRRPRNRQGAPWSRRTARR